MDTLIEPDVHSVVSTMHVKQVFADEKGYLVTEMAYEEVTDDEGEANSSAVPTATSEGSGDPVPPFSQTKKPRTTGAAGATGGAAGQENQPAVSGNKAAAGAGVGGGKKTSAGALGKKAAAGGGAQQRGMMSFFAKK